MSQKRVRNHCASRKALNEQKLVPARRADCLISVKTLALLEFGSRATMPHCYYPCSGGIPRYIERYVQISSFLPPSPRLFLQKPFRHIRQKKSSHLFFHKSVTAAEIISLQFYDCAIIARITRKLLLCLKVEIVLMIT